MTDTKELRALVERLRRQVQTGRCTLGFGSVSSDGKIDMRGNEPIVALANPDGPAAATALESLLSENKALREERDKYRSALVRIALTDRHRRIVKPHPDGGARGPGGMIAVYELIGKNGSTVTGEELLSAIASTLSPESPKP